MKLFTVTALPPGERKSAVFADVLAPAVEWERQEQERMAPIIAQLASEHRILEERLKMAEKAVAKAEDADERKRLLVEAKTLAAEVDAHKVPDEPQVFCDDVTPEKLGQLIARQGGRMLLASAEGTVFEIAKGRYTESPNYDVFLKGHAGDPLRVGRVGRDSESVDRPALSCALAVQPDVIYGLADEATMRGRGFLARWLYSLPTSHVGKRRIAAPAVPETVAQNFAAGMLSLWQFKEDRDIKGRPTAFEICLSRGADNLMREFEEWLEPQLAEGEELSFLAGWANKLPGAIARLAGILHMAETLPGPSWGLPINEGTITAAIQIGRDYYLPHARAAFGLMGGNPNVKNVRRVVRWLVDSLNSLKTLNGVPVFEVTRSKICFASVESGRTRRLG